MENACLFYVDQFAMVQAFDVQSTRHPIGSRTTEMQYQLFTLVPVMLYLYFIAKSIRFRTVSPETMLIPVAVLTRDHYTELEISTY